MRCIIHVLVAFSINLVITTTCELFLCVDLSSRVLLSPMSYVMTMEGKRLAAKHKLEYFETSAEVNDGVLRCFSKAVGESNFNKMLNVELSKALNY